ncbi:RidA family protein [Segnochrobactraceae bacterium EtOH-i3]
MTADARLAELGITLPTPAAPVANYVPAVLSGSTLYISGQLPMSPDGLKAIGQCRTPEDVPAAADAARLCAINLLAQAKLALGSLDRITRVVKLTGFVNAAPGFGDVPKVVNGASDLFVAVLGETGRHARSAVGVSSLPLGALVEVEAILEVA